MKPVFLISNKLMRVTVFSIFFFAFAVHHAVNAQTSGFYTSFDSTKIYYEVKGTGFPVVLIHGFIVNSESWKKASLYSELIDAGYAVITVDLRGNGKSDKPHADSAYNNDAEARDIMGLATFLGLNKYDAVGYSRGAIITARLLVLDKRVSKAVIGGMGADFTNPEWPRLKMFYRALMGDTCKELEGMVHYVQQSGLDQLALAYMQKWQPSASKEELGKVKQDVLIICGDKDNANGSGEELSKLFHHVQYVQVPGEHNNASGTKEFADAVVQFLKK